MNHGKILMKHMQVSKIIQKESNLTGRSHILSSNMAARCPYMIKSSNIQCVAFLISNFEKILIVSYCGGDGILCTGSFRKQRCGWWFLEHWQCMIKPVYTAGHIIYLSRRKTEWSNTECTPSQVYYLFVNVTLSANGSFPTSLPHLHVDVSIWMLR